MCINPLPITNLLTNVLRVPGSAAAMTSTRPSTLKAHEVALRNKKGREVLMMDLKASPPAAPLMLTSKFILKGMPSDPQPHQHSLMSHSCGG